MRRAEGVHAFAREPREGAAFDQPEGALLAFDDARADVGGQRCEGLVALFDVGIGVEEVHRNQVRPSTFSVWPVMKSLSAEERNTTAPRRSSGYWSRLIARA